MIPYVVDNRVVGTGYGISFASQSLGTIFGPIVVGWISDRNNIDGVTDYLWVNIFFTAAASSALLMVIAVMIIDI